MDEKAALEKCRQNDALAFEELIQGYRQRVFRLAFGMLRNREDAEDLTQEIFVKAFLSIHKFDERSSFSTWLHSVAVHACLDELRKRKARAPARGLDEIEEISDGKDSVQAAAEKRAAAEVLKEALEKLEPEARHLLSLRDADGLSYQEIAECMRLKLGTVKSKIKRARMALRKLLEKNRELFL
jgi:RNA polymerase sigma-70 factor (ECF subfamily)